MRFMALYSGESEKNYQNLFMKQKLDVIYKEYYITH